MTLVRLLYASKSTPSCRTEDINQILEVARRQNPDNGISGILCYDSAYFIQWLEGPRDKVNALYADILKDPRHTHVTILNYGEINARRFEKWSMAYISENETDQTILFKYSKSMAFDPFTLTSESAVRLIQELAEANETFLSNTIFPGPP